MILAPSRKRIRRHTGERAVAMAFDQKTSVPLSEPENSSSDLVKLIRKLRWIGMDDEAERLQKQLALQRTGLDDTVVARSGETD
jgi:hypothetical protein